MRDKLIKTIQESAGSFAKYWAEIIADHLLADGWIRPPCKVGDTVYSIRGFDGKLEYCEQYEVTDITVYENNLIVLHITDNSLFTRNIYVDEIDKTVFLTREEAERALRKEDEGK